MSKKLRAGAENLIKTRRTQSQRPHRRKQPLKHRVAYPQEEFHD